MFRKTIATLATGLAALMMTGLAHARDQIQIVGSSTVYPFATVVAEKHGQRGSMKTPVIESTGTGGGMKLFCGGLGPSHPDFANASRAIKGSEKELCAKNGVTEIIEIIVGNDGIAFANSAKSKKLNFSPGQLWMAMAENDPKPKNWSEIDASLPNAPIKILAPPPTSGTRDAWDSLIMGPGCKEAGMVSGKECDGFREDGAVEEAGETCFVLGVDLQACQPVEGATLIMGDITDSHIQSKLDELLDGRKMNSIISDISPHITGKWDVDQAVAMNLVSMVFDYSLPHLSDGGSFVTKLFQGVGVDELIKVVKPYFSVCKRFSPEASRNSSSEVYLVCKNFKSWKVKDSSVNDLWEEMMDSKLGGNELEQVDSTPSSFKVMRKK